MMCLGSSSFVSQHHHHLNANFRGVGGSRRDEMGSNLSKRRSQSSGDLLGGGGASSGSPSRNNNNLATYQAAGGVKLGASLPNHLDSANSLPQEHRHLATHLDSYLSATAHLRSGARRRHHQHAQSRQEQDQGYGSERSPEEERRSPPPHPLLSFPACPVHHTALIEKYPFINSESTFSVEVTKGSGGLGLSVTGGEPWPGLVRIKRLFPHQPAAMSARLQPGDVLLAASGVPLLGLTNYEALEVLRATPSEVKLTVCRPPAGLGGGGVLGPPPPPLPPPRDLHTHLDHHHTATYGEFEIWMEKQNGSLGFTLRKEDQSALGHYVRALVREPALSDTRIRPGDKIIAVNDVSMSGMSHEEAVCFLRQCGTRVKLRLYRDPVQTPLPPHSPPPTAQSSTATLGRAFKPLLRKEAQDMLTELRKSQSPQDSSGSSSCHSKGSSPRKRRLTRTPPPLDGVESSSETSGNSRLRRPDNLNFSVELSSSTKNSPDVHSVEDYIGDRDLEQPMIVEMIPSALIMTDACDDRQQPASMPPAVGSQVSGLGGPTAAASGFSYRNPAYRSANPAPSKPHLSTDEYLEGGCSEQDIPGMVDGEVGGTKGLLKWKGVLFTNEGEGGGNQPAPGLGRFPGQQGGHLSSDPGHKQATQTNSDPGSNQSIDPNEQAPDPDDVDTPDGVPLNGFKTVNVELNRGWNSRLGFSLQAGGPTGDDTVISAIYPDSVASRCGKLRVGDVLVNVNDESVEDMKTADVIDLLRKIRGIICLTLLRKPD